MSRIRLLEDIERLRSEVHRADRALNECHAALSHVAKTGSLPREQREAALAAIMDARQGRLFNDYSR